MYQEFKVLSIETSLADKQVVITCSADIDPESISEITLIHRESRADVVFKTDVKGKVLTLLLHDWPTPNTEYVISVAKFKTLLGDELGSGIRRKIVFKSTVCSQIDIVYPAYDEVITDLKAAWDEVLLDPSHSRVNSYYLEISTETGFHNIRKKSEIEGRTEVDLSELPNGQYYLRVRAQKDDQYGSWSETVTFVIGNSPAKPEPIFDPGDSEDDEDDEIYLPGIKIVTVPADGETPASILIEFDTDIDPDFIDEIMVIRRPL